MPDPDPFPVVYAELRRLAAAHLAGERPGHTLNPTALVHEAYLRLLAGGRREPAVLPAFFAAAAEAMPRILIDHARGSGPPSGAATSPGPASTPTTCRPPKHPGRM